MKIRLSLRYLHSRIHLFTSAYGIIKLKAHFLDLNTLSHKQSIIYSAEIIEYFALDNILKAIMDSNAKSRVTYCDYFYEENKVLDLSQYKVQLSMETIGYF